MIVKKVENPKKSATKKQRIFALVDYILSPTATDRSEKCIFSTARGFVSDDLLSQKKEMIALSALVRRSADTVNHYILSLQEGEHPTKQQCEEMVTIFASQMGWKNHQIFAALHADTNNRHLHIAINRVDPDTEKVVKVNEGKDLELAHQAIAMIEKKQGWMRQKNGRYHVLEDGKLARNSSPKAAKKSPGQRQCDMEIMTGEKSAQRIAQERATNILSTAATWSALHAEMEKVGLRYEKFGSGAKIFVGDVAIKASAVENGGRSQMEKRLGPFQPAEKLTFFKHAPIPEQSAKAEEGKAPTAKNISESKIILESATSWEQLHRMMQEKGLRFEKKGSGGKVFLGENGLNASEISRKSSMSLLQKRLGVYQERKIDGNFFTHTPEQDLGYAANGPRHGLQKLSERRLAHSTDGRVAGVLQINALVDRSKLDYVRRQSQPSVIKNIRDPLRENIEGLEQYSEARLSRKEIRKSVIAWHKKENSDDMKTLLFSHQLSRKRYYGNLSASGSGYAFRIAFKSILAAQHAIEKLDLIDARKAQKDFVMSQYPAKFPPIEQWQRNRGRNDLADQWRSNKTVQDIIGDSDAPPQRRDIRDFAHRVEGDTVEYYKPLESGADGFQIGFVDTGRNIRIHDWRDEETTLAALQLAGQKFGTFAVTGNDEYKKLCVKLAAEHGFKISNPELQDSIKAERMLVKQEREAIGKTKEFQDFERYHAAVGADRYRITSEKEMKNGSKELFLIGEGGTRLKGVMADRVAMKMGEMLHLAKQGQKIDIGPFSKGVHHFVVHGITKEKLDLMQQHGYRPSAIVRTSDGLHTAVINMKKVVEFDARQSVKMGELLSEMYGSGRAAGPSHPAPGFFQTELIKAAKEECTKVVELARKVLDDIEVAKRPGKAPVKPVAVDVLSVSESPSTRMLAAQKPKAAEPTGPKR